MGNAERDQLFGLSLPFGLSFEHFYTETTAEPTFHRDPLRMLSLLDIPLPMSSCFQQDEKVLFQPLVKNIGEKSASRKGGLQPHFLRSSSIPSQNEVFQTENWNTLTLKSMRPFWL
jgi:hypothetical protein